MPELLFLKIIRGRQIKKTKVKSHFNVSLVSYVEEKSVCIYPCLLKFGLIWYGYKYASMNQLCVCVPDLEKTLL